MNNNVWYVVEPKMSEGGDVGGDIQAGPSHHLRFWNDALVNCVIDVHVYATARTDDNWDVPGEWPKNASGFGVQVQSEFCICGDRDEPFDTEEWSDATYENLPDEVTSLEDAKRLAGHLAREYADGHVRAPTWDGLIWHEYADRPGRYPGESRR